MSPDGKKVAFIVRGEVFAASAADGGDAARVSNSHGEEYQLAWSPDSRRLVYVSDRDGVPHLFQYDFTANAETQLTHDAADDSTPRFSPDGKSLAFIRGARELRLLELEDKKQRVLVSAFFERPPLSSDRPFVWSPDGKWLAYVPVGENQFKNVNAGDYLLSVDGRTIDQSTNLDELLSYKVNRRVSLIISASADGSNKREVIVRPTNGGTERGLLYRQWVERNREYVAKASNGRLGYVHMFDMSTNSLNQLHIDLDADNYLREGVVIDIRNNGGGFVNVYAIDVFARRGYLTMTLRGRPGTPARTVLGQRALSRPTILVTNQHSLSDAEDFTEGYRTLRLGQVVGEQPPAGLFSRGTNH